jgi:hypothetical protein
MPFFTRYSTASVLTLDNAHLLAFFDDKPSSGLIASSSTPSLVGNRSHAVVHRPLVHVEVVQQLDLEKAAGVRCLIIHRDDDEVPSLRSFSVALVNFTRSDWPWQPLGR